MQKKNVFLDVIHLIGDHYNSFMNSTTLFLFYTVSSKILENGLLITNTDVYLVKHIYYIVFDTVPLHDFK